MDILKDSAQFSRLEIVDTGRRRRWSDAERLRIVEESCAGVGQVSATARRHGITRSLLSIWRKKFGVSQVRLPKPTVAVSTTVSVEPDKIEITLPGGTRLSVGQDIDPAALRRIVKALA